MARTPRSPLRHTSYSSSSETLYSVNLGQTTRHTLPDSLLSQLPNRDGEFGTLRYSAVNVDPKHFTENFTLRQQQLKRETELLIVVTVYNEEEYLVGRTLAAVFRNIQYLCEDESARKAYPHLWGAPESWQRIVVCIVCDGEKKLPFKTKCLFEAMGFYQAGTDARGARAHIYEHTTQVKVSARGEKVLTAPGKLICPAQVILCIKEQNAQKINSHRWAFQAFGRALRPFAIVLIDVGTKPDRDSIFKLWESFYRNEQLAGACGEIRAQTGNFGRALLNPLVAAQNFEYKMSNILDKPLESGFGFISVLPGAFSAYRFAALDEEGDGFGPLSTYFEGEEMHKNPDTKAGLLKKNMYLAEDRILCFELVMKRDRKYVLEYISSAKAETDVPDNVCGFIKQRRRWLNGTFFASLYALAHVKSIFTSGHSVWRKMVFLFEFLYQFVSLVFGWFSLANMFLIFWILTTSLSDPSMGFKPGKILGLIFEWLYFAALFMSFVISIGSKPERGRNIYTGIVIFWCLTMVYIIFAAVYISVKSVQRERAADLDGKLTANEVFSNRLFRDLILSLGSTYALYLISSVMFLQFGHMLHSFPQYILVSPAFVNVVHVYAFCNIHDVSWGTRDPGPDPSHSKQPGKLSMDSTGARREDTYRRALAILSGEQEVQLSEADERARKLQLREAMYRNMRCWMLLIWCSTNALLVATILNSGGLGRLVGGHPDEVANTRSSIYLSVVLWSVTGLSGAKFLGAVWFISQRVFRRVCGKKRSSRLRSLTSARA